MANGSYASGEWTLSPAYDLLYTDNDLGGNWMMMRGKRADHSIDDVKILAEIMGIRSSRLDEIINELRAALENWPAYATQSGVGSGLSSVVQSALRRNLKLDQT